MTAVDRTSAPAPSALDPESDWPSGCSPDSDGALRLHGTRLDELAAQWGTPLSVVDEPAFLCGVQDLIQVRGARPLFDVGLLSLQTSRWAERSGWDVWGDPAGHARSWHLSVNAQRKVVDLRGQPRSAGLASAPSRMVVDVRNLDLTLLERAPSASVYLSIDSVPARHLQGVLAQLAADSRHLPQLAGLALRLEADDTADTAADRFESACATVRSAVHMTSCLIVDGADHPDPLPVVRRLVRTIRDRPGYDPLVPTVLADLSRWLFRRASVVLVRVDSARTSRGLRVVGLSGGAPGPAPRMSRPVGRPNGPARETLLVWPGGEAFRVQAPDGIIAGDVLALPAMWSTSGLCLVVAADGVARAVPGLVGTPGTHAARPLTSRTS